MSHITQVILITASEDGRGPSDPSEHPNVDRLNAIFSEESGLPVENCLRYVSYAAGGSKNFADDVFMAAFNHFSKVSVLEAFRQIRWEYPESVALLVQGEDDECFALHQATQ